MSEGTARRRDACLRARPRVYQTGKARKLGQAETTHRKEGFK